MMRLLLTFLAVVTVSGLSFFAGYFLTQSDTPIIVTTTQQTISGTPGSDQSEPPDGYVASELTFVEIERQFTIFDKLKYAHELADTASITELETYINDAARSRDPLYNYNLVSVFLEKYTALDPLGAIDFVDSNPNLADQQFITHVVTSWVRTDPEAAIDYFKSVTDLHLRNALGGRLLGDPTLQDSGFNEEILATLGTNARNMAGIISTQQLPPAMAFEQALQLESGARQSAMHTALIRWLREDPDQVVNRIQQHPNLDERTRMFQSILNEYINIDEDAAYAFAQQNLTGNARTEQHMLMVLGQRNPVRTLPLVEDFIARTGNINPLNSMVSTWVQQDPQAAINYIDTLGESQRANLYQSVAYSYVNSHPEQGFTWLLSQREEFPQLVRNTIGRGINHGTLSIAERTVSQVTDPQLRTQLITGIGNYKATQDPESALSWLEQYRSDAAYPIAVQNVISSMSHQNPRAAAAALEQRLDSQYAAPLAGQIVASWYRANPSDALDWANNLKNTEVRANALSNVVMMIAQQDSAEAFRIVRSLPEGEHRDNAKRNVAYNLISNNPQDAESIINELDINPQDARHMREMARQRNRARSAVGSAGATLGIYPN